MANFDSSQEITPIANFYTSGGDGNVTTATTDINSTAIVTEPPAESVSEGAALTPVYRGLVGSNFVYQTGSPPAGATLVTIIGFV